MRFLRELIFAGLLRGWPGARCSDCRARPYRAHQNWCRIGKWDGGVWA